MTSNHPLADRIDAVLPQTQCGKCGFDGCRPYASAIARGEALINRCPPGGTLGIAKLAALLDTSPIPLDTSRGDEKPAELALIDEAHCIGCTLCIQACPVDAILGTAKRMHSVLLEYCTGCELCIPPCPVDCISMVSVASLANQDVKPAIVRSALSVEEAATQARQRYYARNARLPRQKAETQNRLLRKAEDKLDALTGSDHDTQRKREAVMQALARARSRRTSQP